MVRHSDRRSLATRTKRARRLAAAALAISLGALLLGCAATASPDPTSTSTPETSVSPAPEPSSPPQLVADGTASDNLPIFAAVTAEVWAGAERASGGAYIDALTAAGFDKASMQVTDDTSTIGNPAESIQFSVLWGQECLVGQVGPATGEPHVVVVPMLAEGNCLVGQTRAIDW